MTSSNFPPNSLFKSSIKSRSNSASYLDLICWRWALERVVRIFIISSSLVPKPFIAARKVWLSAAASKGLTGTTVGMGCAPKKQYINTSPTKIFRETNTKYIEFIRNRSGTKQFAGNKVKKSVATETEWRIKHNINFNRKRSLNSSLNMN
uniref:Uncharacterized protein n=1 Tax=Glossina pallidipes TaxID=7398 RepID=A0A1A9Z5U8_GLOPL